MTDTRVVRLPADLCSAVERKFAGHFADLEELLTLLLRDLSQADEAKFDRNEQRLVEERLRELGYL